MTDTGEKKWKWKGRGGGRHNNTGKIRMGYRQAGMQPLEYNNFAVTTINFDMLQRSFPQILLVSQHNKKDT